MSNTSSLTTSTGARACGIINLQLLRRGYDKAQKPVAWSKMLEIGEITEIDQILTSGLESIESYDNKFTFICAPRGNIALCRHFTGWDGKGRHYPSYDCVIMSVDDLKCIHYNPFAIFNNWHKIITTDIPKTGIVENSLKFPYAEYQNYGAASDCFSYLKTIENYELFVLSQFFESANFLDRIAVVNDRFDVNKLMEIYLSTIPIGIRKDFFFSTAPHVRLPKNMKLIWATINCRAGLRASETRIIDLPAIYFKKNVNRDQSNCFINVLKDSELQPKLSQYFEEPESVNLTIAQVKIAVNGLSRDRCLLQSVRDEIKQLSSKTEKKKVKKNDPSPKLIRWIVIMFVAGIFFLFMWGIHKMENINSSISQPSFVDPDVMSISFKGVSNGQFSNTTLYPDVTSSSSQVCEMQLNGNDFQLGTEIRAEGDYTLKATCIDDTGKSYEQTLLFTIDKTAPLVRILGVEDGKFFNQKVSIAIDVSDKNIDSSNIRLNDNDYESGTEIVSDGDYKLTVEAVDKAGNATNETINFTIDWTEPEVKFINVSENGIYNHKLIPRVSVIDEHLVKQTYHLNNEVFSLGTMVIEDGRYQLEVHAVDKAGNRSDQTVTFTIDQTSASIEVHGVEEGRFYGDDVKPLILIDGKEINDKHPGDTVLNLNDKVYKSGTAIVAEGNHVLHLVTRDEAGNEAEKTTKFGIIKSSPKINVANVEDDKSYKEDVSPKIDIITASLHHENTSILLNDKTFSSGSLISVEGVYHLNIEAYDTVGNRAQKELHFTIDKTAPAIEIAGITRGGLYNKNVKPFVTFSDNNAVDDKQLLLNDAAFQSGTIITEDGSYTLQATGRDKAGNESTKLIMFEIDAVAPLIEINGIKDKAHYPSDVIPQITVRNFLYKTIRLNDKEYYEGNHIKDDGAYTLTITAKDKAGNEATEVKSFVIDTQPPKIKITGIQNGSRYCEAVIPQIDIVEDYKDNDNSSILLNDVPYKSQTPIVAPDDYKLEVKISDQAGNKDIRIVKFTINRKEPAILIDNYDPEEQLLKGHICNFEQLEEAFVVVIFTSTTKRGKDYDDVVCSCDVSDTYISQENGEWSVQLRTKELPRRSIAFLTELSNYNNLEYLNNIEDKISFLRESTKNNPSFFQPLSIGMEF